MSEAGGTWHHVVVKYTPGTNQGYDLFIDNIKEGEEIFNGIAAVPSALGTEWHIGRWGGGFSWNNIVIDNVAIWTEAKSDAVILAGDLNCDIPD